MLITVIGTNLHVVCDDMDTFNRVVVAARAFGTVVNIRYTNFDLIVARSYNAESVKDLLYNV